MGAPSTVVSLACRGALLAAWLGVAACMTMPDSGHEEGLALVSQGRYEQGIAKLEQLVRENPENARYRVDLVNARTNYLNRLLADAARERAAGRPDAARKLYERAGALYPASEQVRQGVDDLKRDQRHAEAIKLARAAFDKGDIVTANNLILPVLAENPQHPRALELRDLIAQKRARDLIASPRLEGAYRKPVNLEFRDASLRTVFDALSRSTGINYILDKDVRPELRTTVISRGASLEEAIDLILMTSQLEKKVLNQNTLLIYPATPQKLREYQDLLVKGFYLVSADVKQIQAVLKSMLKIKEVSIDEKLRLVVVRDTPEAVRLAEKLIAMHDLGEPEVMLELEVLEVRRSRLLELGIQWPDQLTLTPLPSVGDTVTLRDLRNLNSGQIGANLTNMIINLKKQDGDVNLLANPRVRAKNREKARILIGDRVPVITTTAGATGFVSQNVQYLDVGLKVEIEPDIQLDSEVGMKVALEVSSVTREIVTTTGLLTYEVGTRTAATALRLRDGETEILAGLISDADRRTANRVPGLGDMPVIGRLFSSQRDDQQKTEIILSITPRLVRGLVRPDFSTSEFWSGSEVTLRTRPISLSGSESAAPVPASAAAASPAAPITIGSSAPGTIVPASTQAVLSWRAPAEVKVGQEFKVDVVVKTQGDLRSLPMQLSYDPAAFQVVSVQEGPFFRQGGEQTSFAHNVDHANGRIFVGVSRSTGGVKGEDTLVSVIFRARAARPKSELRVVAATPVSAGRGAITVGLPEPRTVGIAQ
jgi:general secretion pathway protein D